MGLFGMLGGVVLSHVASMLPAGDVICMTHIHHSGMDLGVPLLCMLVYHTWNAASLVQRSSMYTVHLFSWGGLTHKFWPTLQLMQVHVLRHMAHCAACMCGKGQVTLPPGGVLFEWVLCLHMTGCGILRSMTLPRHPCQPARHTSSRSAVADLL